MREQTCLPAAKLKGCAGGLIESTASVGKLTLRVLENEPVIFAADETLDVRAKVPIECLGIDSVERCDVVDFYASPLFFGYSTNPLDCEASECGSCACSGKVLGGGGAGAPWKPGASTLAFGAIEVPYCVEGDTMWAGGGEVAGEPKVAYKFRRRSCVGKPLACDEQAPANCDTTCDFRSCDDTPGCSWGEPKARCGGERAACYELDPAQCHSPGCSMRTCDVPDGWGGIDSAPCERLSLAACANAEGCAVSGASCVGTTTCAIQDDPTVCAMLECAVYEEPTCGGYTTTPCSELSVEDCRSQPGCRLEW